jgi:hypothetical protein
MWYGGECCGKRRFGRLCSFCAKRQHWDIFLTPVSIHLLCRERDPSPKGKKVDRSSKKSILVGVLHCMVSH